MPQLNGRFSASKLTTTLPRPGQELTVAVFLQSRRWPCEFSRKQSLVYRTQLRHCMGRNATTGNWTIAATKHAVGRVHPGQASEVLRWLPLSAERTVTRGQRTFFFLPACVSRREYKPRTRQSCAFWPGFLRSRFITSARRRSPHSSDERHKFLQQDQATAIAVPDHKCRKRASFHPRQSLAEVPLGHGARCPDRR